MEAEDDVVSGERIIARQWAIVTDLARDGHDTTEAKSLLATFEQTLRLDMTDCNRIRAELARCW
jgi:hypothetical protein